jgi:hypothetical protein
MWTFGGVNLAGDLSEGGCECGMVVVDDMSSSEFSFEPSTW